MLILFMCLYLISFWELLFGGFWQGRGGGCWNCISYALCFRIFPGVPCPIKAINDTGDEQCCFIPFEHEGVRRNDCVKRHGAKNFTCPLDRFQHNFGICRKFEILLI